MAFTTSFIQTVTPDSFPDVTPTMEGRVTVANDIASLLNTTFGMIFAQELDLQSVVDIKASVYSLDTAIHAMTVAFGNLAAAMNRERNALVLAATLPPELLLRIFGFNDTSSTLAATAVCHRWRATAISASWLWTTINLEKISDELASILCKRSGNLPIDLCFRHVYKRDKRVVSNEPLPEAIAAVLPRVRSMNNLALDNWMAQHVDDAPTPRLESCRLLMGEEPLDSFLNKNPSLSRMSLDFSGTGHSFPIFLTTSLDGAKDTLLRLSVLHLHSLQTNPRVVHLIVELTPGIEELYFSDCSCSDRHTVIDASSCLKQLRILSLSGCSSQFAASVLHLDGPIKVNTIKFVELVDTYIISPSWQVGGANSNTRLFILEGGLTFLYEHECSITRIEYTKTDDGHLVRVIAFPQYIWTSVIESLAIDRLVRVSSVDLDNFTLLKELYIDFQPMEFAESDPGLSILLNGDLAARCPQLRHITIQLMQPHLYVSKQRHEVENDIKIFLSAWHELNHVVFPSVHIHDEIQPSIWTGYMEAFRAVTGEFVVYGRCTPRDVPWFPRAHNLSWIVA